MANRLSKIVTKRGDKGETSLAGGVRVRKDSARIMALGEVDELNCCIGLLLCELTNTHFLYSLLQQIQHDLFDVGGQLACPDTARFQASCVTELEQAIEEMRATLAPLKEFILPNGSKSVAQAHFARAVCRRCERALVHLDSHEAVNPLLLQYINRLSDGLFIMARILAKDSSEEEILWHSKQPTKNSN